MNPKAVIAPQPAPPENALAIIRNKREQISLESHTDFGDWRLRTPRQEEWFALLNSLEVALKAATVAPQPSTKDDDICQHGIDFYNCDVCEGYASGEAAPQGVGKPCRTSDSAAFAWFDKTMGKMTLNQLAVLLYEHRNELEPWL